MVDDLGEVVERGVLEEVTDGEREVEGIAESGGGAGGQEGVPAEFEEVGIAADPSFHPQYLTPDAGHPDLGVGLGRRVVLVPELLHRLRQRVPADLSRRGQREAFQHPTLKHKVT